MITKEAIEAAAAEIQMLHGAGATVSEQAERILTAALAAMPGPAVVDIVPPHCSGSALAFEPGVLHVNKNGSGYIAINEDDFVLEDDRCEGPDGPEGSVHWITNLDASEIVALRDFLNGVPRTPAPDLAAENDRLRAAL